MKQVQWERLPYYSTTDNYERRVRPSGTVYYSIFSEADGEYLHLAPEQMVELWHWLTSNQAMLAQDTQRR